MSLLSPKTGLFYDLQSTVGAGEEIMSVHVRSNSAIAASSVNSSLLHTGATLLFGLLVLFAVGFAPAEAAHNAAHDTRHALAFPCH
jgi:cobalt transporter subunit CbtB